MPLPGPKDLEDNDGGGGSRDHHRQSDPSVLASSLFVHAAIAKEPLFTSDILLYLYDSDKPMELIEEMQRMLQRQNEKIESMWRENQELREKVSSLTADISRFGGYLQHSPAPRMPSDKNCSLPLRLRFVNACCNDKYSTRKIEADDKSLLKVAIYDQNNKIITCEPFSSMRVHIVAIHGDFDDDHKGRWTEEHFHSKIVTGRRGKEQLLFGKLYFRLQDGVGYLNSARFQDNSSFVPSKRFKLGVTAADERISERIQEGITESFAVKDIRGFYCFHPMQGAKELTVIPSFSKKSNGLSVTTKFWYPEYGPLLPFGRAIMVLLSTKKSCNPSPHDAVYKLSRIAMNGDRHRSLERNGIKTVEDLLCSYSKNPDVLRKIMGKISEQDWDKLISHALKCEPRAGAYYSCIHEGSVSREHWPFSRRNDSCCPKESSSVEPNPTIQKQLNVRLRHHQIYSMLNGPSSAASSQNVPRKLTVEFYSECLVEEFDSNTDQQVTSVGNEILPVPSMNNNNSKEPSSPHIHSLECKSTPEGNRVLPGNPSAGVTMEGFLSMLETTLLEDEACGDFDFSEMSRGSNSNVVEHSGGLSCINEARNMNYGGRSPASEAGSVVSGGVSPASEMGSINYRKFLPSPIRKAGNKRFREEPRLEPVREADTVSDASTYFRAEDEC
ncbi:hypothetical protein EJB05_23580 [Eragrostis curvula]|uniref:Uncharacterized protein n=1 Tax=Eragrostis curvula TaxID=38414 RepID=A0A5J9V7G6_9POAL|nr:hypothetical protein EJB05_23580 [Eragrostis curvula]